MRVRYLLVVAVLWAGAGDLAEAEPRGGEDGSYAESRTFRLKPTRDGGFSLTCDVEVAYTFHSERSTRDRVFFVPEPFYAEVSKLRGELGGERLPGYRIGVQVPEYQDVFMTSGRVHYLEFPDDLEPGDVARYSYRESYDDVAYLPVLKVPNADHLSSYHVTIEHPDDVEVDFSFFYPRETLAPDIDRSNKKRTELRFHGLGRSDGLPYFPFDHFQAAVLVQITQGGVPVTPNATDAFGAWYRDLVGDLGGDGLAAVAAELERETPRQTVAAIHDHVRSSIRYVADERAENAIVPRPPGTVLANGYGDCKDRAFLVAALARELGLDVDVVLVSTGPVPEFEGTHVGLYDHVISRFEDGEGTVFFDPTHRYVPFGALPESDVDASALAIGASGSWKGRVPAPPSGALVEIAVTGSLAAPAEARAEVTVRGGFAAELHRLQAEGTDLEMENFLSVAATEPLRKLSLDHFIPLDVGPDAATFSAVADLSDFVVASPTRRYVPHTPFRTVDPDVMERAEDDYALYFSGRPHLRLTLDLETPDFAAAEERVEVGGSGPLHFEAALSAPEAGRTRIEYAFHHRAKRLSGDSKAQYLAAAGQYLDARRGMFILRPLEDAPAEDAPAEDADLDSGRP
ncbi:MAG: transglutaminase domain-containing protein [Bacteroidota bacterium]